MKAGIIKLSALARLGTWSPRAIFADAATLDAEIAAARADLTRAQARLDAAIQHKADELAREATLVARGDLEIITDG
jgi:multidrug efflux pump subunit AcrA (membrane-fusion protein)